jgi:hypothetical protein
MLFHFSQNGRKLLQGNFGAQQVQQLNETAHVGTLVVVGQIHKHVDDGNGMLRSLPSITNGDGIAKIFNPNLIDGNIAVIRLALYVFHDLLNLRFRSALISEIR